MTNPIGIKEKRVIAPRLMHPRLSLTVLPATKGVADLPSATWDGRGSCPPLARLVDHFNSGVKS